MSTGLVRTFSAVRGNFTFVPNDVILAISGNSDRRIELLEAFASGMGIASAVINIQVGTGIDAGSWTDGATFRHFEPESEILSNASALWGYGITKPSLDNPLFHLTFNACGGSARWSSENRSGDSPVLINRVGEMMVFKGLTGGEPMTLTVVIREANN